MPEAGKKTTRKESVKVLGIAMVIIGIGIILYLLFIGIGSDARNDDVSLNQINQESQENPVILYFWSGGCSYCEYQKPIMKDLENDYKGSNVTFYWFDAGKNKDLTDHYNIQGYPTTVLLNKSGVQEKFVGYTEYEPLATEIEVAIDSYN